MIVLAAIALVIWLGLLASSFWLTGERDDMLHFPDPERWPEVVAVVPARNEADVIVRSLGSLAEQDYPGSFRIVLVDDNSSDATGEQARGIESERIAHWVA